VVAGTVCGFVFAVAYYFLVNRVLRAKGLMDWIVDHPWACLAHVRDTDAVEDVNKFDWEMWRQWKAQKSKVE
ncbi:hypothetical protein BGZ59_001356, partial [Podila verticillata]